MKTTQLIAGSFASLFLICFFFSDASAQRFKKKKPETLYARNKKKKISPIYVGIGTGTPTAQLHVYGKVRFEALDNSSTASRVGVLDNDGNLYWRDLSAFSGGSVNWQLAGNTITAAQFLGTINNDDLRFRTNNTQRAVLTNAGSFGLGLAAPTAQLHTSGTVRFEGITSNNTLQRLAVFDNNGNLSYRDLASLPITDWTLTGNSGTNPSLNFMGTTDNNRLVLRTNNTEKMTILANGRIGIGTATPLAQFHVSNAPGTILSFPYETAIFEKTGDTKLAVVSSDATGVGGASITLGHSNFTTGGLFPGYEMQYGNNNQRFLRFNYLPRNASGAVSGEVANIMVMTENSRVGVNLGPTGGGPTPVFPTANFHVNGTVRLQSLANGTGNPLVADANGNVFLGTNLLNDWSLVGNSGTNPANNFLGTTDNNRLVFRTNNVEKVTILSNGNVGIGLNNPSSTLQIYNTTEDNQLFLSGTAPSTRYFQGPDWLASAYHARIGLATISTNYVATSSPGDFIVQALDNGNLLFGVGGAAANGVERMRITPAGRVGIGTTSPKAHLHISSAAGAITTYPYETAVFEKTGDTKLAVVSSDATGIGGASITLGHSNFTTGGLFPGYEMQYGNNNQRYLRFNYLPRNASGAVTGEVANIMVMTENSRVGINLGPTGGGPAPIFPTANFHVSGTVRMQGLPTGSGSALVVDANGNVFRSTILAGRNTSEDVGKLRDEINELKKEMEELKKMIKACTSSLVSINGK